VIETQDASTAPRDGTVFRAYFSDGPAQVRYDANGSKWETRRSDDVAWVALEYSRGTKDLKVQWSPIEKGL